LTHIILTKKMNYQPPGRNTTYYPGNDFVVWSTEIHSILGIG